MALPQSRSHGNAPGSRTPNLPLPVSVLVSWHSLYRSVFTPRMLTVNIPQQLGACGAFRVFKRIFWLPSISSGEPSPPLCSTSELSPANAVLAWIRHLSSLFSRRNSSTRS
jgi:hypothetical protein